jgi:protein involved in polysaccharide export with SLBB domain
VAKSFNLDPSSDGAYESLKMTLGDGDLVKIYPVYDKMRQVVFLDGHVKYPREYELKPGMKLRDLIPSYDSLLDEPYLPLAEIIRLMPPDFHPEIVQFNLGYLLEGDEQQNLTLQDRDRIIIYDRWEKIDRPEVTISGAIRKPGTYQLYEGMTAKDLIFQAGNLMDDAYMEKADLTRLIAGESGTEVMKISFSLKKAMLGSSDENLLLRKDDFIQVRNIPEYAKAMTQKVVLEGEFMFPGTYSFEQGERLSSVIERAGGLTDEAYPYGAAFQREDVKRLQTERMRDYIDKLEQDVMTMGIQSSETALDKDETEMLQEALAAKKALLEKMKASQVSGRMVINLEELITLPSSDNDLELKSGDRLIVKARPDYVNIIGEVYNPTALFHEKEKSVGYYLDKVGSMTKDADKDQTYVVRADGSVISRSQEGFMGLGSWNSGNNRWSLGGFDRIVLNAGDTIVVPKKVTEYPWLRITKEITQVLYQIAVTAGVIIVAF